MKEHIKPGYRQTEVGVIPEDWDIKRLNELIDPYRKITYGIVVPGKFTPDGIPMIRAQDYSKGWVSLDELYMVSPVIDKSYARSKVATNDVLLTIVGSIGNIAKVPPEFNNANLTQQTARLAFNEKVTNTDFYINILRSQFAKQEILNYAKSGVQPSLNLSDVEKFQFPYPPIAEQEKIAEALSDVDSLIESLEEAIAKKRHIKQGAMQELLTGKRRLIDNGEWIIKKLGEIFEISAGGDVDKNNFSPIMTNEYIYPIYSNSHSHLGLYGFSSTFDHEGNAITVTARGDVGFAIPRFSPFNAIGRLLILRPAQNINCKFIAEFINQYINFANESTGVPQLTAPQIAKYEVNIPPKAEQEAIAEVLTDMDNEITALEEKLNKTRQLKQGMMQELLTGRIRLI